MKGMWVNCLGSDCCVTEFKSFETSFKSLVVLNPALKIRHKDMLKVWRVISLKMKGMWVTCLVLDCCTLECKAFDASFSLPIVLNPTL